MRLEIQNPGNLKSGRFRISDFGFRANLTYGTVKTENDFKAAVRSIISRSPLFASCPTKNRRLEVQNKMWLDVCVNEMAPGPFAAVVQGEMIFDSDGTK